MVDELIEGAPLCRCCSFCCVFCRDNWEGSDGGGIDTVEARFVEVEVEVEVPEAFAIVLGAEFVGVGFGF